MGTWIEIETTVEDEPRVWGRSLRGNVDRNAQFKYFELEDIVRRSLRGNVDRNNVGQLIPFDVIEVVPYVGTWIEMV